MLASVFNPGLLIMLALFGIFFIQPAQAQDAELTALQTQLDSQVNAFGQEESLLTGLIRNDASDAAYASITIFADLIDEEGAVIGEAFGYVVDACGNALLDDPIQPGQTQHFAATVDLFELDAEIADYEFFIEAEPAELLSSDDEPEYIGLTQITEEEVVQVDWTTEDELRYGVGCADSVFTTYDWYRYDLESERNVAEVNPNVELVTPAMIEQAGITQITQTREINPTLFETSFLTYPPQSERVVWQTDIHTIVTGRPDGSFRRVVHSILHQYTLQGFVWSPLGNFLAYYFGGYGEPVRYFTASGDGQRISNYLQSTLPSRIVPGMTDDGWRAIIGTSLPNAQGEETLGYYLADTRVYDNELLFEVEELPGNNYPAPAYWRKDNNTRYIYLVRDIEGQPTLQCFHREAGELYTLTPLPLELATNERAWTWLSPQSSTLALAANGRNGGLWLIDLDAFEVCR